MAQQTQTPVPALNDGPLAHITRSSCFAKGAHNNTSFDPGLSLTFFLQYTHAEVDSGLLCACSYAHN